MKNYAIDLTKPEPQIVPALPQFHGQDPAGNTIDFTNHYLQKNNLPYFGICGEFHFSRYDFRDWDEELLKMKMGGINIVPTYVIWNHHEEIKGTFDWEGSKNLHYFLQLCQKHHLYVILRIGPFDHGEVRNGGFPDWLYGEPCCVRANDELYLFYTRRLYHEIGLQAKGMFYQDGGPVIGVQLENEYCHSAGIWNFTDGTSNEWMPNGTYDGDKTKHHEHIHTLKTIANEEGIIAPFYTGTGWGGAEASTDQVLPLWGGYAFWPWIFYDPSVKEHPVTPEYIYRDYRKPTYNFEPAYDPKTIPFACCEMGGGMVVFYNYRFQLPFESVDAMANIKVASGCNFVGYYVYHGGSNPRGKRTPYLNETVCPKISYDYQAVLGEFGQERPSYHRLRRMHYFYKAMEESFCPMQTVLPDGAEDIAPTDTETVRFAVRHQGRSGYVFLNNYQDHLDMSAKKDFSLTLQLPDETLTLPETGSLSLDGGESCILPFHLDLGQGIHLNYATAQLITTFKRQGRQIYFFYAPKGMQPAYQFAADGISDLEMVRAKSQQTDGKINVTADADDISRLVIKNSQTEEIVLYTLTDKQSLDFWCFDYAGEPQVLLSADTVLTDKNGLQIESERADIRFAVIDDLCDEKLIAKAIRQEKNPALLTEYILTQPEQQLPYTIDAIDSNKWLLHFGFHEALKTLKDVRLSLSYQGDIGYAFMDSKLINDNYCNGAPWEIGLKHFLQDMPDKALYLNITPLKPDAVVQSDSPMAARSEVTGAEIVSLDAVKLIPVYQFSLSEN